jgi:hypothetical protein
VRDDRLADGLRQRSGSRARHVRSSGKSL